MTSHGVVGLKNKDKSSTFLVNSKRVKHYFKNDIDNEQEFLNLNDE